MAGGEGSKPKLFQFWNTEKAPDEVEILMQTWAADPAFQYHRFTTKKADAFIEANFDDRTLAAYRKCAIPAMQADFFRYCALYIHGGVYVDADTKNSARLPDCLKDRKHGLLMTRETRVANDFLYVRVARSELYRKVIECAVENVENEISNNVWMVTGPGIMTHLRSNGFNKWLFEGFDFEPARKIREYVIFQGYLDYKSGRDDWRAAMGKEGRTIYSKQ